MPSKLGLACNWGSGEKMEIRPDNVADAGGLNAGTLQTAPSVPGGGYTFGSGSTKPTGYVLRLDASFAESYLSGNSAVTTADRVSLGFWMRPNTNPTTSGDVCGLLGLDDGLANGMHFGWKNIAGVMTLFIYNYVGTTIATFSATGTFPATATQNPEANVTNPWFYLRIIKDKTGSTTLWTFQVYSHNGGTSGNANSDFTLRETLTATQTAGNGMYVYVGQVTLTGTGKADVGNVNTWWNLAAGTFGPLAPSMNTGWAITKEVNSIRWVKGDTGADDTTTGSTDTEYPYINETTPSDVSTSYLKVTAGTGTFPQRYKMTATLVPASTHVHGYMVRGRFYFASSVLANALGVNCRFGTGAVVSTPTGGSVVLEGMGAGYDAQWYCDHWFSDIYQPGSTTAIADGSTDTDIFQATHNVSRLNTSPEARVSQLWMTVLFGQAESVPAAATLKPSVQVI